MDKQQLIDSIFNNNNEYFSYNHFIINNMQDYTLMKSAIEDITSVYNIEPSEAVEVLEALIH